MSDETKLFAGIIVATLAIIGGALFFLSGNSGGTSQKVDAKILIRDDSPKISSQSATISLVEFGDYQCPACGVYHPLVQQILSEFKDSLTFVFREYPLPMHPNGPIGAQAAVAAGKQGKYWEMHDALYTKQSDWSEGTDARSKILGYAKDIGLNMSEFTKDLDSAEVKSFVDRDVQDGNSLGVNATPTFYLDREKIDNPASLADFETLVKAAILRAPKPSISPTAAYHIHANFAVNINGKAMDFTQAKYQSSNGKDLNEDIHLHDGKGDLMHIHKQGVTLGDFFASLKMKLTKDSFTDDAGNTNAVRMYVNGKENTQFDAYVPQDLDKILITTAVDAATIAKLTSGVADDACIYSLKCPERGKPPTENCVGGLGTGCSD